jgi:ClpP class serine protease
MNESAQAKTWGFRTWFLYVIIPLVVGILLSLFIQRPKIGVITLNDAIASGTAQDLITQIVYARTHPEIKAVILVLNTPGGTVTDTESVYMELARLRQTKPVIAMVEGLAASGGYYLLSGTDYAFAKPSSTIGNIGVLGFLPTPPTVISGLYSTGPYKLWGEPQDTFIGEMEMLKQGFYHAVLLGRGSRLKAPASVILRGQVYTGSDALRMGLIDELGSISQAYDKAAQMAHIAHYQVLDLKIPSGVLPPVTAPAAFFQTTKDGATLSIPKDPGIYLLYVPNMEIKP